MIYSRAIKWYMADRHDSKGPTVTIGQDLCSPGFIIISSWSRKREPESVWVKVVDRFPDPLKDHPRREQRGSRARLPYMYIGLGARPGPLNRWIKLLVSKRHKGGNDGRAKS